MSLLSAGKMYVRSKASFGTNRHIDHSNTECQVIQLVSTPPGAASLQACSPFSWLLSPDTASAGEFPDLRLPVQILGTIRAGENMGLAF